MLINGLVFEFFCCVMEPLLEARGCGNLEFPSSAVGGGQTRAPSVGKGENHNA